MRGRRIAGGHRLQGEEPCRFAAEVRSGVFEKPVREPGGSLLHAPVALMECDAPERDDTGGVEGTEEVVAGVRTELPFEDCAGIVEPAELVQLATPPDL